MNFFQKKTTLTQNIAFMALLAAIDAVFSVLATLVPFSDLLVVLFLPLVSALAGCYLSNKYLPIYVVAAIALCLIVSCYDLGAVLFYVIPAILSGTLYGFLIDKRIPISLTVFVVALLEMGLNYLMLNLVQVIYQVNMIDSMKTILGCSFYHSIDDIIPTAIFGFSLAQTALSHFFIVGVLENFKKEITPETVYDFWKPILGLLFGALALGFGFVYVPLAYLFLAFSIYFSLLAIPGLIRPLPWWVFLILGILEGGSIYGFALLRGLFPNDTSLLLVSLFFISVDTPSLISSLLLSQEKKSPSKDGHGKIS
jgi:hypothetical protein